MLPGYTFPPIVGPDRRTQEDVQRQLTQLLEQLNTGVEYVKFNVLHAAPVKPRQGLVVFADGTDWNPGSGEGLYVYKAGGWTLLG